MADRVKIPRLDASFSAEIINGSIMVIFIQLGCRVLLRTFFKTEKHGWQGTKQFYIISKFNSSHHIYIHVGLFFHTSTDSTTQRLVN